MSPRELLMGMNGAGPPVSTRWVQSWSEWPVRETGPMVEHGAQPSAIILALAKFWRRGILIRKGIFLCAEKGPFSNPRIARRKIRRLPPPSQDS